jgi:hypothetical protein
VGGISDLRLDDGAAELLDSRNVPPDDGLAVAIVQGVGPKPEQAFLMASNASQCSEDPAEMAEAAYGSRLEPEAATLFKAHVETCPRCRQVYKETLEFVDAIRAAAEHPEWSRVAEAG